MARVLITGANGFTGGYLVERLARDGHELFGLVHHEPGLGDQSGIRTYEADLRDPAAIRRIVAEVQPERIVHLAAIANVAHGDAAEMYSSNILGTRNLLQALATASQPPSAVMIASSANIYGNRQEGMLSEDAPPAPANDYGVTKAACELLAQVYADRLPIIMTRPFNYTGRGQPEHFLIPKIVAHVRARASIIELGNLEVARDFSDVRSVVDSYARLLDTPAAIGKVFNVCSGKAHTLAEIIELAERVSGHRLEVRVNKDLVRADEVKTLCGSRARLESVIGAVKMPNLAETLVWMLDA